MLTICEKRLSEAGIAKADVTAVIEGNSKMNNFASKGLMCLFHWNELGKATFMWEEATAASTDFIAASIDIKECVHEGLHLEEMLCDSPGGQRA